MENLDRYVGKLFDRRYRIRRVIGVGGMAVVFEATDLVMNRIVAVKMLKDEMSGDDVAVKRFINESKAVSMLSHPNIVKIFDVSVKGNLKYFVMERIEGITLKSYMQKKGALSTNEVLSYSEQVLRALEHAHAKGIVHRDIKPQNILLLRNGRVKVTDFGIATLEEGDMVPSDDKAIGTVYYISPEQANGKDVDHRSDLYSLGVMMYEMASGALPFNADTPVSVALKQVKEQPKPPSEIKQDIPIGLEQIILGAMEKSPERRFQSADQMLRYVEKLRANPSFIFKTRKPDYEIRSDVGSVIDTRIDTKKKKPRKHRRESNSMFPIVFGVSVAFLIVFVTSAITILDLVLKDQSLNASRQIEIPNVIGSIYSSDSIDELFDPALYEVEIITEQKPGIPVNAITKQDPEAGFKKLPKNQKYTVTLTVNLGAETVVIPDYSLMDYQDVKLAVEALGLKWVVKMKPNPSVDVNLVLYTEPGPKTKVEKGSTVTIWYSGGSTIEEVTVPSFINLTPAEAAIRMDGILRLGPVYYIFSDTVSEGLIASQSLEAQDTVIKGTFISFGISLGPDPNAVPPVTDPPETPDTDITDPGA